MAMIQGKSYSIGQVDGLKYIEIPKGWRRILENGLIQYISPSSSHLKSYEHVIEYLKADGTCKCGLDCPFYVHRVFNFDTSVQNKEQKDELPNKASNSSMCKLCEKSGVKGKNLADEMLLQRQPLKQAGKRPAKFSPFDGNLTPKKALSRSRPKLSDGTRAKKPRKVSSPLSDTPSPPPIPISSPVQNVPNNIGTLNQGPLPSFASIVSSSKFFNPGPHRGPLHPTGSLPLKTTNNGFTFPKAVSKTVTTSTVSMTTAQTVTTFVSDKMPSLIKTVSSSTTTAPTITSSPQRRISKLNSDNSVLTVSAPATTTHSTVSLVTNVSTPKLSESVCKPAVVPIISTPTLPSAFAPLDGLATMSTDSIKLATKPQAKPKPRSRPTRPRRKPKTDTNKSKFGKGISNTLTAVIHSPVVAAATTFPVSNQWSVPVSSVISTVGQVSYQTPSTIGSTTTSVAKNIASNTLAASLCATGNSISRSPMTQSLPQQATMPSPIYMTAASFQNQGAAQSTQMAYVASPNLQPSQVFTTPNQSSSSTGNGKDSVVISPTNATPSSSYPVVATPRIQPPPGLMYVAAPGVGMLPANYPYVAAASAQQLQLSQASYGQAQNRSSSTATTIAGTNQPQATQGVSTDAGQGKVSFQVPGMFVQGAATNQMFPVNAQGFNVNQYKAAYQLQNAMYPGAVPGSAMAFIAPNGAKATYPGIQTMAAGNIGQFATYTNPYMFGIVMTTTTNQPSSVSVTSTRSTPATQTCVTTSLQMIQPQGVQNPAIAAAFESFVPIAPAAGGAPPRFAQTLAHLASAYNAFPAGGLVQGPNPNQLHLAYQMMQMNPHSNAQQVANVGGMAPTDGSLKHPLAPSKSGQPTSTAEANKGGGSLQTKGHSVQSPTSSVASPVSIIAQDHGGGRRSPFTSPPITASPLPTSSPPCTSLPSVISVTQAHQSITTKSDHFVYNQKPLQTQSQDKCPEPLPCSVGKGSCTFTGIESSCSDTQRVFLETNKTANNTSHGMKPVVTAVGSVSTDHSNSLEVTPSLSHYSISPLQKHTSPSSLSESDTSKNELSSEVKSQNYHHQVDHDNLNPVRTPNFPVEHKLNYPNDNTGASNSHCSRSHTETSPNKINSCTKGGVLVSDTNTPTRTRENRDPVIPTNYADKVNYYETNPLLGMKRSCEAIEVYPDPPENPNCTDDEKEDYYSSADECMEEHPFGKDDTTSDIVVDHRQGENRHMEEPFRITNQVHNTTVEDLYNGGCNDTCNEPDIQSKYPNMKPNQTFVGETLRPDMFGNLSIPHIRPHFDVGDVVWAQARGLPSWPGKIVDESKVGKGKADDGKKWVMWFGDHTFSQVEVDRLKTLNDGLRTLDDKARKKKYRAKKARISLEQAISEALEELEMRKQLRARQAAMRPKTKKKRLR